MNAAYCSLPHPNLINPITSKSGHTYHDVQQQAKRAVARHMTHHAGLMPISIFDVWLL